MADASDGNDSKFQSLAYSTSTSSIALFQDPKWLGFTHDGYPLATLGQYRVLRGIENPTLFDRNHVSILQSWFSFGLLEAVLELPIPESMLLKQHGEGMVMSIDRLPQILSDWVSIVRIENEELVKYRNRVESILTQVHKILSYLSDSQAFLYTDAHLDDVPATFVTLGCIAEALVQARHFLYPDGASPKQGLNWDFVIAPYAIKFYADTVEAGWCLSTVRFLVHKTNLATLRFAFRRGPLIPKEHHDKCSAHFCSLKTVDTANYVPKHLGSCHDSTRSCVFVAPPVDTIISFLQEGTNPVIDLSSLVDRESTILSVRKSSDVPYVAISHVWADGCGSTAEKGLPSCQVQKIFTMVSDIMPNGAFWMDSLCVPKHPETRKQALKLMGKAYLDAEFVLVLDSTIQACSSKATLNELLLHVALSPWMRRLWTLQEAMLAKKLVFKFSDGLVPFSRIIPDITSIYHSTIEVGLAAELQRLSKLRLFDNLAFADVARCLRWRWTSNITDEVPAILSLIKVDRGSIFEDSVEKRMINLLLAVVNLPKNIIFLSGPKMEFPGFRWAPLTLMSIATGTDGGGMELSLMDTNAICTPLGLFAEYFVFGFEEQSFEAGERFALHDPTTKRTFFLTNQVASQEICRCNFILCNKSEPVGIEICVAVWEDIDVNGTKLDCVYVGRLIINGQRPDKAGDDKIIDVLASGNRQILIS